MTTPSHLDRKTIWFTPPVWLMLTSLMRIKGDDSPSLTVEHLIREAYDQVKYNKTSKGTAYGRTTATA